MSQIAVAVTVDARGLACPMPVVKTKKALDGLKSGDVLELLATDKGSAKDLQAWVRTSGHELLESSAENGLFTFYIKKG